LHRSSTSLALGRHKPRVRRGIQYSFELGFAVRQQIGLELLWFPGSRAIPEDVPESRSLPAGYLLHAKPRIASNVGLHHSFLSTWIPALHTPPAQPQWRSDRPTKAFYTTQDATLTRPYRLPGLGLKSVISSWQSCGFLIAWRLARPREAMDAWD
jgi:hypothetical protein